jgi:hypothetical protein
VVLYWWLACTDGPSDPVDRPRLVAGPQLIAAPLAPLARELTVETDVPTRLTLALAADQVDSEVRFPTWSRTHRVPVLGARPDREHVVTVSLEGEAGHTVTAEATFRTEPLDPDFPAIEVRSVDEAALQTRYLLAPLQTPFGRHWLVVLDARDGGVVWAYTGPDNFGDVDPTGRGSVVGLSANGFLELDWLGQRVARLRSSSSQGEPGDVLIDASLFTHELVETEDGYRTLALTSREVDAFPLSYDDPTLLGGPTQIVDADVLDIARDGTVRSRWSLADRLDPLRIGFDSLDRLSLGWDWAHPNALLPDPSGVIVSLRHQDALVALDHAGDVRWILSNPHGWSPAVAPLLLAGPAPDGWPLHQHGPSFDADGNLVFFDNGNEGYTPYTEPPGRRLASRVTAIRVDEDAHTAETAWVWLPPGDLYSPALGNATGLPGGHVLANYGFVSAEGGEDNVLAGRPMRSVRIFEVDPARAEPVLDLAIDTEVGPFPDGVKLYRAIPFDGMYPAEVEVLR